VYDKFFMLLIINLLNNKITEKDELGKIITSTYDLNNNLVK